MPTRGLGIPDRRRFRPIPVQNEPSDWEFGLQRHLAQRAGPHFDLRLAPNRHAHSWAIRRWPGPGDKALAVQQPTHSRWYMDWSGDIPAGQYGGGKVELADRSRVKVIEAGPDKIKFVRYRGKEADEFDLVRTNGRNWLLINSSTTPGKYVFPQYKPSYATTEFNDALADREGLMSPKVDGAHGLVVLQAGKYPRVFSVRKPVNGGIIEWTHKIPGLTRQRVPAGVNTVLRAEVFLTDQDGKAAPAERTAGVLNASIERAHELQTNTGGLKVMPFADVKMDERGVPYEEQVSHLGRLSNQLPFLQMPQFARTRDEKLRLMSAIRSGRHPMTREGVVVWSRSPMKAKLHAEADVYPIEVFRGEGKYSDSAGGFSYSRVPGGPPVGKVGTGFSDELRNELWKQRSRIGGRVAVVRYDKEMPSGALYGPRFMNWHPDKDPGYPEDETVRDPVRFKVGFLRKLASAGVLPSDVHESAMLVKSAAGVGSAVKAIGSLAPLGLKGTLLLAGTVPLALGATLGAVARRAARADDEDVDEVRTDELINQYRDMARAVRERTRFAKRRRSDVLM